MNWLKKIFKFNSDKTTLKKPNPSHLFKGIPKEEISLEVEKDIKDYFDLSMNPREWMACYGHNIFGGDCRMYLYQDKELENWIEKAFTGLFDEGLENLWKEFLTTEEIKANREALLDP